MNVVMVVFLFKAMLEWLATCNALQYSLLQCNVISIGNRMDLRAIKE